MAAPKTAKVVIYTKEELKTLDREELVNFRDIIDEAISETDEDAMKEIKEMVDKFKLDTKQLALFLGVELQTAKPVDTSATSTRGAGRTAKDADPRITEFKQEYADRIVKNRTGKGRDYHVGKSRGAFPGWISDKIMADQVNELHIESDEDYAERVAGVGQHAAAE